ncbi:MAG: host attachment protein [Magnetospirillum sp.]
MRSSHTWVCVADGVRARIFRCDGPQRDLEPVLGMGVPATGPACTGRIAGQLDRAATERRFDHLVLVGPRAVLAELETTMAANTRQMVTGELDRDLSRASPRELTAHLCELLPH